MGHHVVVPNPSALMAIGVRVLTGMAVGLRTPREHEVRDGSSARVRALRARRRALRPA